MESARRREAQEDLGLTTSEEQERIDHAIEKEEARRRKKEQKRQALETDSSYRMVKGIATVMDKFFLDPIIGFFLPAVGDILTSVMTLPYIMVALFKVRLHIPADTRSAFPVISVHSPVSIQCRWQS